MVFDDRWIVHRRDIEHHVDQRFDVRCMSARGRIRARTGGLQPRSQIGPLAPCVLCRTPTVCRSPVKDVPCHKDCAETWITSHSRDAGHRTQLIRAYTPGRGEPR